MRRTTFNSILFLVIAGILSLSFPIYAAKKPNKQTPVLNEKEGKRLLELINKARTEEGLPPLQRSDKLDRSAQNWATQMKQENYLHHGGTNGVGGQTIARGQRSSAAVVTAWLKSSGHRAILLGKRYRHVGFGRAGAYWVADFN